MTYLETADRILKLAAAGELPSPDLIRALQSPHLDQLSEARLRDLGHLLVARLRSPGVKALVGEITPQMLMTMLRDREALDDLLAQAHQRQQVVLALIQSVKSDQPFSLDVCSAFGVLTSAHAALLRQAIQNGEMEESELLQYVDNGTELSDRLDSQSTSLPLRFETLLDAVGNPDRTSTELAFNSTAQVQGNQGRFQLSVSNGYELWRAATFHSQEPETVAWLDDTFHDGDCLYDVGANIGLYSLYALAKTTTAQVVCFEPDAVNYYRLSGNIVANQFGPRAMLFPIAMSDTVAMATFNSSLFVAGKAENWISPGAELMGEAHPPNPWQQMPVLRTGCPTFDLDSFVAQTPFLPPPTHLKIDVDSVEIAILEGASQTLQHPALCHVLVELYDRDVAQAQALLAKAGFQPVRHVAQRNVLPCYEEPLCNHIFAKSSR